MTGTAATFFRWAARLTSIVSIGMLALFAFGGQEDMAFGSAKEVVAFAFFPVVVVVGFVLSWKWEFFGAVVSILSLAGFYLWHFAYSGRFASGPWFAIFTSPALLFLIASMLTAKTVGKSE